jgi:hypothetical protein
MKKIETEIAIYREAVRHLWNTAFAKLDDPLRFGVCAEWFEQIETLLFRSIVCEPLNINFSGKFGDPIAQLRVTSEISGDIPVLVNRGVPSTGYWDAPVKSVMSADSTFAFIGFFDWDEYAQKDLRYYRVRFMRCDTFPELIGRDALIETCYADVFLN